MQALKNLRRQESATVGRLVACTPAALRCAWIFALVFCLVLPALAQVNTSVQGRVFDTTGAAISQATITVVNTATGVSKSTQATTPSQPSRPDFRRVRRKYI
jgi:hypothetical protein